MTDPRIYQVFLEDQADAGKGLALARRFLAASGKPAGNISVWASLAPSSVASAATLLPHEILSADITLEPGSLADLAKVLGEEPRVHGWFLVQRASIFGASLGVGTPHPSRDLEAGAYSTVWFDFGDDPVPEAIENGRFGRWLAELASVGLLPPEVSAPRLMERFATAFGRYRADRDHYGRRRKTAPGALSITIRAFTCAEVMAAPLASVVRLPTAPGVGG